MTSTAGCTPITFCEVYGRGAIVQEANLSRRNLNIEGMKTFDLRVRRDDGEFWDLSRARHRAEVFQYIDEHSPDWVICGPPCTSFSLLNRNLNFPKMTPEAAAQRISDGMVHLRFACALFKKQVEQGKNPA